MTKATCFTYLLFELHTSENRITILLLKLLSKPLTRISKKKVLKSYQKTLKYLTKYVLKSFVTLKRCNIFQEASYFIQKLQEAKCKNR